MHHISLAPSITHSTPADFAFLQDEFVRVDNAFACLFDLCTRDFRALLLEDDDLPSLLFLARGRMCYLSGEKQEDGEEYQTLKYMEEAILRCSYRIKQNTKILLEEYARCFGKDVNIETLIKTTDFLYFIKKQDYLVPPALQRYLDEASGKAMHRQTAKRTGSNENTIAKEQTAAACDAVFSEMVAMRDELFECDLTRDAIRERVKTRMEKNGETFHRRFFDKEYYAKRPDCIKKKDGRPKDD